MIVKEINEEHYIVSDTICGKRVETDYFYYTKEEAIALFKEKYQRLYELQNENILDEDF